MAKQRNIWKFNDNDWKVHISDASLLEQVKIKFDLGKSQTIYYGKEPRLQQPPTAVETSAGALLP